METDTYAQRCDQFRQAVTEFKSRYGDEKTVGVEEVLQSDYMSSEHSDIGEVPEAEWNAHRDAQGHGLSLEIRTKEWRSEPVSLV